MMAMQIGKYMDPDLCKTCQILNKDDPKLPRVRFGDCEEHFKGRVRRLLLTGIYVI